MHHLVFDELIPRIQETVELAAVAAARTRGRLNKDESDKAATQKLRVHLNNIRMRGIVRVGEGELDGCTSETMLPRGEKVGLGWKPEYAALEYPEIDIATDPLEGTELCAEGAPNSITTLAISERGGIIDAPDIYMDKLVVGPAARGKVSIEAPVEDNLKAIANALNRDVDELTIMVLKRPRHDDLVSRIQAAGAQVAYIPHGDLTAGILCSLRRTGIHAAMGIGGSPEGFLTAVAQTALGGEIQGRFLTKEMMTHPEDKNVMPDDVMERLLNLGINDPTGVLHISDLVPGKRAVFAFAAVTDSTLMDGVRVISRDGFKVSSGVFASGDGKRSVRWSEVAEVINQPDFAFSKLGN